jgi:hypothetical protein
MPPEQEDRFAEPRRAARGDLAHAADALDERDQSRGCVAPLLGGGPMQICHPWQGRTAELATELDHHRGPAVEQRTRSCVARCAPRAVPIQPLEIEGACPESEDPDLDRAGRHAVPLRDAGQGNAVGESLSDCIQDHLDAGNLARQRLERQDSLAVPATAAARQRHREHHRPIAGLQPPRDPTASKPEIAAVARGTPTADEELVASAVDDHGVLATLDVEYEDHVLMTAPG